MSSDDLSETHFSNPNPCTGPLITSGREIIDSLSSVLSLGAQNSVTASCLRQLDDIVIPETKVVIGLVGTTGSGKSSIINALLDEKQLIPTSCVRACTAAIIEISFDESMGKLWRACVEFISQSEWEQDLRLLLDDLRADAMSIDDRECEAGIAFAKVQAVYPFLTQENVSTAKIEELLRDGNVMSRLDKNVLINATNGQDLHDTLQNFVESQEDSVSLATTPETDNIQFWPLIRKVRVFGSAPILSSGCVLVDLPGDADSNAARAAVHRKYLQECTAIFIVAPIIRAVDDQTARNLTGKAFRSQLHRDGILDRVTFVCSKIDDIKVNNAIRKLKDRCATFKKQIDDIASDKAIFSEDVKKAKNACKVSQLRLNKITRDLIRAKQNRSACAVTEGITEPSAMSQTLELGQKRRLTPNDLLPNPKRLRVENCSTQVARPSQFHSDLVSLASDLHAVSSDNALRGNARFAQTLAPISTKLQKLTDQCRSLETQKFSELEKRHELEEALEQAERTYHEVLVKEFAACIAGRNEYAKAALQAQFRHALKDLHQEESQEDTENFDPDAEVSIISSMEIKLPVFCVSAQGYQEVRGWHENERLVPNFTGQEKTGIPALRDHVWKLGKTQMLSNELSFLNDLKQCITSLRLLFSGTGSSLTVQDNDHILQRAQKAIGNLFEVLKTCREGKLDQFQQLINDRICGNLSEAIAAAQQNAVHKSQMLLGSLHWQTIKAIVRRNGKFSNAHNSWNFNADLLEPFTAKIDHHWASVFGDGLEEVSKTATEECVAHINTFSEDFDVIMANCNIVALDRKMFKGQIERIAFSLWQAFEHAKTMIKDSQKNINRTFELIIESEMVGVYADLSIESGRGMLMRMKAKMSQHIARLKDTMFVQAGLQIQNKLKTILEDVRGVLNYRAEKSYNALQTDCMNTLSTKAKRSSPVDSTDQERFLVALQVAEHALLSLTQNSIGQKIEPPVKVEDDISEVPDSDAEERHENTDEEDEEMDSEAEDEMDTFSS